MREGPESGVLNGVTVVDLSELLPGPNATRLLAGLGATVIKVERPDSGDRMRNRPAMFETTNRGKRSLALDLKTPAGRSVLFELVRRADFLVEGYRPGVLDRLGLSFATLAEQNPKIVVVSVSGYGATGPYRSFPGHDYQYLAFAGAVPAPKEYFAADYVPTSLPIADMGTSMYASLAIILAVLERTRDPENFKGRHIDLGMADCALALMEPRIAEAVEQSSTEAALRRPGYGVYRTRDDLYVSIGAIEDQFWCGLVIALDLPELISDELATFAQRREHTATLERTLRGRIAEFDRTELFKLLTGADVPIAPLNDLHGPLSDSHFRERGMAYTDDLAGIERVAEWPVALSTFADRSRLSPAPIAGEHSREILNEIGMDPGAIDELMRSGVVVGPTRDSSPAPPLPEPTHPALHSRDRIA